MQLPNILFRVFNISWVFDADVSKNVYQLLFGLKIPSKSNLLWVNGLRALLSDLWLKETKGYLKKKEERLWIVSIWSNSKLVLSHMHISAYEFVPLHVINEKYSFLVKKK